MVRAGPALSGLYLGKPVFKEVGPLKLDPEIQQRAMTHLNQTKCELNVKIEAMSFEPEDSDDVALPNDGLLVLNKEEETIEVVYKTPEGEETKTLASCKYSESYPLVEIIRKSYASFELHLGPSQIFKLTCKNHLERDIFAVTIRMFNTGKPEPVVDENKDEEVKEHQEPSIATTVVETQAQTQEGTTEVWEPESAESHPEGISKEGPSPVIVLQKPQAFSQGQSPADPQGSKFEDVMRIEQLTKKLKQAEKDKNELRESLALERGTIEKMSMEILELQGKVEGLENENKEKDEKLKHLSDEKEKISAEKLFFSQELILHKNQIADLKAALEASENTKKEQSLQIVDLAENKEFDFKKSEENVKELTIKVSELELHKEQLQKENKDLTEKLQIDQTEKEELQATINGLKKRIQSLVQETSKRGHKEAATPQPTSNSSFWNFPLSPLFGKQQSQPESRSMEGFGSNNNSLKDIDEVLSLKEKVKTYEEELRQQREKNLKLTKTIETMKTTQDAAKDAKKGILGAVFGEAGKQNAQDTEFMQKIVNTLTETVAEKDFMIQQTKQVNKELGKRIHELEAKLKEEGKDKVLRVKC